MAARSISALSLLAGGSEESAAVVARIGGRGADSSDPDASPLALGCVKMFLMFQYLEQGAEVEEVLSSPQAQALASHFCLLCTQYQSRARCRGGPLGAAGKYLDSWPTLPPHSPAHTSAYVSIRQHTSAYTSGGVEAEEVQTVGPLRRHAHLHFS